jgi:hypothetical protein
MAFMPRLVALSRDSCDGEPLIATAASARCGRHAGSVRDDRGSGVRISVRRPSCLAPSGCRSAGRSRSDGHERSATRARSDRDLTLPRGVECVHVIGRSLIVQLSTPLASR